MNTPQVGDLWRPLGSDRWGAMEVLGAPELIPPDIKPEGNFKTRDTRSGRVYPFFKLIGGGVGFEFVCHSNLENK